MGYAKAGKKEYYEPAVDLESQSIHLAKHLLQDPAFARHVKKKNRNESFLLKIKKEARKSAEELRKAYIKTGFFDEQLEEQGMKEKEDKIELDRLKKLMLELEKQTGAASIPARKVLEQEEKRMAWKRGEVLHGRINLLKAELNEHYANQVAKRFLQEPLRRLINAGILKTGEDAYFQKEHMRKIHDFAGSERRNFIP